MNNLNKLLEFSGKLKETESIQTEIRGESTIQAFQKKIKKNSELLSDMVEDLKLQYGLDLKPDEADTIFLTSYGIEWSRPETFSKEGFLTGGFSFNGLSGLFEPASSFWKKTTEQFEQYNPQSKADTEQLSALVWVESQFHFANANTVRFPFATCAEKNGSSLPESWQYFYTTPKNLIDKNNGISYFPWHLATSDLADGINDMNYRDEIKFDRLDLIAEYLERCIRLLPETFPSLNFEHHKTFYAEFKRLYDEVRE